MNPNDNLRVREIERKLKLPLPSVIRYCKELKEEGVLTVRKIGSVTFYTADKSNPNFLLEKKIFNFKELNKCGLIKYLKENLDNPVIIVFGSYSRGEDTEDSDIDLYIETLSNKKIDLERFEKKLKRNFQVFRYESLKKISNIHLANNIVNGIVLNNYLEVFK